MKKAFSILLAFIMLLNISACGSSAPEIEPAPSTTVPVTGIPEVTEATVNGEVIAEAGLNPMDLAAADFAVRLFKTAKAAGENTLISPLSVMAALGLTANGAKGSTLSQIEDMLGMSKEEMNAYFRAYQERVASSQTVKMHLANSAWFKSQEADAIAEKFLQIIGECYRAEAFAEPFDDTTLQRINNWVNEHTHGMIPTILDKLNCDMYLLNALAFEAKWKYDYIGNDVKPGKFTREDGTVQEAEMMHKIERQFIRDEKATGFIKPFEGEDYAFVALLPNEGITVDEYLDYLTGEGLMRMLLAAEDKTVVTSIPKFKMEYEQSLKDTLLQMGMEDAFLDADFSGFGSIGKNLVVADVIHKTFFAFNETGVSAGAATVVQYYRGISPQPDKAEHVILDRPFVYILIDCRTNTPIFMGTMMDISME